MSKNQEVNNEVVETEKAEEVISKAEYDKLKAELDKLKSSKADEEDKTLEESRKLMTEKAVFRATRKSANDEDVFVCVNGKSMRLKRGVDVEIPKAFALVLERAQKQEEYAMGYSAEIAENEDKI